MIKIGTYSNEDAIRILGTDPEICNTARLNQVSGPAYTAFKDDKPVACGGIRTVGVGEVWALYSPEIVLNENERSSEFIKSEQRRKDVEEILTQTRLWLETMMRNERLWRLYSESPESEANKKFLRHLGFRMIEAFLRG